MFFTNSFNFVDRPNRPYSEIRQSRRSACDQDTPSARLVHSVVVDAAHWGDDVRLSDLEPRFTCKVCGRNGADVRPLFERVRMGTDGS
jgi:hypothetical protein